MTGPPTCPRCGTPLAPTARAGNLCPRCLLGQGLADSGSGELSGSLAAPAPDPEELAGDLPELEVLELIGQGGMGAVYRARQRDLDRPVALKVLPAHLAGDPDFTARFEREARALARLSHPGIVAVHGFGRAGPRPYLVMELVDGASLRALLRAGRVEPREALSIVMRICDALQYAHDQGVVHRDIKPENVLVDRRGRVKIADFGLAKLVSRPGEPALTHTEQTMGTPHYMAPEQLERSRDVDHRADIYSLGVVFYELLTGELPLGRFEPPSRRVEVDVRLDDVVLRALAKEPERRFQRASEVKTEIEGIVARSGARPERPAGERRESGAPSAAARRGPMALQVLGGSAVAGFLIRWLDLGPSGAVLSGLALAAAMLGGIRVAAPDELRSALAELGWRSKLARGLISALLFTAGFAGIWLGLVEGWTRSTPDYASSRRDHRALVAPDSLALSGLVSLLEGGENPARDELRSLSVRWDATDRPGGFSLEHRRAHPGTLLAGALLLLCSVAPIVVSSRLVQSWSPCWRIALEIPLLALLGLGLSKPFEWLHALDRGELPVRALVFEWRFEQGIDATRQRAEAFLAEQGYRTHARVLGTLLGNDGQSPLAHYDVLGADVASPFERLALGPGEPERRRPCVRLELIGDLEQKTCAVRLHAGEARADRAGEWRPWLESIERRLRSAG